jgi:hypothetical protein
MDDVVSLPRYLDGKTERLANSTDVVLEVEGMNFPVHAHVLAVSSKFFDQFFNDLPGHEIAGA